MITKFVNYPWGKKAIKYDSFVFKSIDTDNNFVFSEIWAKDAIYAKFIFNEFERAKRIAKQVGFEINEYNPHCFEYLSTYNDDLGSVKLGKNKSQHRILTYIQGFLAEKQ